MKVLTKFKVKLDPEKIQKRLGYPKTSLKISNAIKEQIQNAQPLIEPMAIYELIEPPDNPVFKGAARVAIAICTIGKRLEKETTSFFNKKQHFKGLVLDTIASYAAEEVAELTNIKIVKKTEPMGFKTSRRFSPGYKPWTLEGQKLIFKILDAEKIGVKLLPSLMMEPRKSVSFAINLFKK